MEREELIRSRKFAGPNGKSLCYRLCRPPWCFFPSTWFISQVRLQIWAVYETGRLRKVI